MKKCAICGESLDDSALECSLGHSLFKAKPGVVYAGDAELLEGMLRNSSAGYTTDEIAKLVPDMLRVLRNARSRVTQAIVDRIACGIENRRRDRLAKQPQDVDSEKEGGT